MIETILLIGGPLDGQLRSCSGGNLLKVSTGGGGAKLLVYRRAHADSKFFHFSERPV